MDNQNKRIQVLQDELLLRLAAGDLMEDAAAEFQPYKETTDIYDRPQQDTALRVIIRKYQRRQRWADSSKQFRRYAFRTAALALMILSAMTVLFLTVEAFRIQVLNLFTREESIYMDFGAVPDQDALREAGFVLLPTAPPTGYHLSGMEVEDAIRRLQYSNAAGETIFFEQHDSGQVLSLDTEQYREEVQINGNTGYLIQLDGFTSVIWEQEGHFCVITGALDQDTALEMAESVQRLQ